MPIVKSIYIFVDRRRIILYAVCLILSFGIVVDVRQNKRIRDGVDSLGILLMHILLCDLIIEDSFGQLSNTSVVFGICRRATMKLLREEIVVFLGSSFQLTLIFTVGVRPFHVVLAQIMDSHHCLV